MFIYTHGYKYTNSPELYQYKKEITIKAIDDKVSVEIKRLEEKIDSLKRKLNPLSRLFQPDRKQQKVIRPSASFPCRAKRLFALQIA
ncbi:MAG: hypothetical protein ACK41Q_12950 [Candidatus Brocadia sp.]